MNPLEPSASLAAQDRALAGSGTRLPNPDFASVRQQGNLPGIHRLARQTAVLAVRSLQVGQVLHEAGQFVDAVWRVERGTLRLDLIDRSGESFVQLVLPGDHLGVEAICGLPALYRAKALTPCLLHRQSVACDPERRSLISDALVQQWCRAADQTALRTGTAGERVRQLLLLLGMGGQREADGFTAVDLPRLSDMATIVHVAPETVSRILSHWRRAGVLQGAGAAAARFDARMLAACDIPRDMTCSSAREAMAIAGRGSMTRNKA